MSVSLDLDRASCSDIYSKRNDYEEDVTSPLDKRINHAALERLSNAMIHLHRINSTLLQVASIIIFDKQTMLASAANKMAGANASPANREYTEGNNSALLGGIMMAVGSLLFLIPGAQGAGYTLIGTGLGLVSVGVVERDNAYRNDPNYIPPQPSFNRF